MLLATQQVAGAAKLQIEGRDLEPRAEVAEFLKSGEAFSRDFGKLRVGRDQQVSIGPAVRPADASTELVKFGKAVTLAVLDNHGVGQRNIQTIFYNCRTY